MYISNDVLKGMQEKIDRINGGEMTNENAIGELQDIIENCNGYESDCNHSETDCKTEIMIEDLKTIEAIKKQATSKLEELKTLNNGGRSRRKRKTRSSRRKRRVSRRKRKASRKRRK